MITHGRSIGLILAGLLVPLSVFAFEIPANDGLVTIDPALDSTVILTKSQEDALEKHLLEYKTETSNEIAIVILKTLDGEPIENVGLDIGRKWGIGSVKNNGVLLLIVYDDREMRIEVGYGLEGAVPDIVAKGIIETDMVPNFRDGAYADGIAAAVNALEKHIGNEYTAERYTQNEGNFFFPQLFIIGLIILQWLIAVLGRTKSWWLGGVIGAVGGVVLVILFGWWLSIPFLVPLGLLLDYIVSKNYKKRGPTSWWAGGGWGPGGGGSFGGGSSGGFGGFGGGSFGGGGASGKW